MDEVNMAGNRFGKTAQQLEHLQQVIVEKDALIAKMQKVVDAARESYLLGEELEAALDALDEETKG